MRTLLTTQRWLLVAAGVICAAVAMALTARATSAELPATATVCIKPNGQIRAVTPASPVCVAPEAASEWTINGVKAITAGAGLVGRDNGGIVGLEVDPGLIENANSGKIFAGFDDGPRDLPNAFPPPMIAELPLPAGSYAIFAKLSFHNPLLSRTATVDCKLQAGEDFDEIRVIVERIDEVDQPGIPDVEGTTDLAQVLEVVHRFWEPGTVFLRCGERSSAGTQVVYQDLKIIAIRGSSLSNTYIGP